MVCEHHFILFTLLGLGQEEGAGFVLWGSLLGWQQLNEGGPRGQEVEPLWLIWPQVQS